MRPQDTAYIIERLAVRFMAMVADHERQLAEHRASFGARTEADAKIIAGLRAERDRLQTQVQDMRAEMEQLQMEVAALKSQTPKHPVKVGEWVRITGNCYDDAPHGYIVEVLGVLRNPNTYTYTVIDQSGHRVDWSSEYCEPCDPPTEATHDTPTGKQAAAAAVKTEPVADEIKVGDVVEVFQSSSTWTFTDDVGKSGTITRIETDPVSITEIVHLREHPDDAFALCDVRKVTT